jgi:hypothetical protein
VGCRSPVLGQTPAVGGAGATALAWRSSSPGRLTTRSGSVTVGRDAFLDRYAQATQEPATAVTEITNERSCRSIPVQWAWLDLNLRLHPYSEIDGSALCGPAFPQVAIERQGRRDAFLAASFQAAQARQMTLPRPRLQDGSRWAALASP